MIKDTVSSGKNRQKIKLGTKFNKNFQNPYPLQYNEPFKSQKRDEISRNYKHSKSNSEAVRNPRSRNFQDSVNHETEHVYLNKKSLKLGNINPEQQILISQGQTENDQNLVIFSKDFNTVKYSQSPFLNKLTNLKHTSQK